MTGRLARSLNVELVRDVGRRIEQEREVSTDARDLVMRGWAQWYRPRSMTNSQEALQTFEQALALDPRSVDARIGVATILAADVANGWSRSPQQDEARAEQLVFDSLGRDANSSAAHFAMGILRRVQNRLVDSRTEMEAAVGLDRNNAWAVLQLGLVLMWLGQPEEGIPHIEKAIRLNPHDPNIAVMYWALGAAHLVSGHVDQAIDFLTKARAANPGLWFIHQWLAGALGLKGDLDEAKTALAESLKLHPQENSFASMRAEFRQETNAAYWALREKTVNVGLRRAGFPEE